MNESWVNGRKSLVTSDEKADNPDNTFEASANAAPNLLVVRNGVAKSFDIFGGQYLEKGGSHEVNANCCVPMYVHEVIFFDTALTDDQIREVTAILAEKWKVQVATDVDLGTLSSPFAADSDYVVTASTGLDLDGFWQTIKSLTFDVGGAESCPTLAIDGKLDVTDTPLAFLNAASVGRGDFLTTTWGLTSPFLSVTGLEGVGKVSYRKSSARISTGGTVILVR